MEPKDRPRTRGASVPGMTARDLVSEWDRRHGPHADAWMAGELLVAAGMGLWWVLRAVLRHPVWSMLALLSALGYATYDRWGLALLWGTVAAVLAGWRATSRASFDRSVSWRVWGSVRGWWVYGRRWSSAMTMCGLGDAYEGHDWVPVLRRVTSNGTVDRLTVRLLQGQHPDDYSAQADTMAHTFGMLTCRVRVAGPGVVWLDFTRRDALAAVVPALDPPETPELDAVALGQREDGGVWLARVRGSHTLIAGATGAGKGSVLWSLIRALCPAVRARLVQLWVLDPKGGMELAAGQPLFHRFACDTAAAMAELLEDAVAEMRARAARLRGVTRLHVPSVDEPLIVVLVDELAALTAYADRDERKRMSAALSLLLSQGRAVGVVVVAALQDPRKDVLPFRDLFPTRIALALVEAEQTDMVLGPGARDRGADCTRIPLTQPGTGWVWCDGEPEPARVRASYVTDADIAAMAERYRPDQPTTGPVVAA